MTVPFGETYTLVKLVDGTTLEGEFAVMRLGLAHGEPAPWFVAGSVTGRFGTPEGPSLVSGDRVVIPIESVVSLRAAEGSAGG